LLPATRSSMTSTRFFLSLSRLFGRSRFQNFLTLDLRTRRGVRTGKAVIQHEKVSLGRGRGAQGASAEPARKVTILWGRQLWWDSRTFPPWPQLVALAYCIWIKGCTLFLHTLARHTRGMRLVQFISSLSSLPILNVGLASLSRAV
jgi:hypothetical protein